MRHWKKCQKSLNLYFSRNMANTLFITLVTILLYPFIFYPLILILIGKLRQRIQTIENSTLKDEDLISLIICAKNEESVLKEKLESILSQRFDKKKIELILLSDGSQDQTATIMEDFKKSYVDHFKKVIVVNLEPSMGKNRTLKSGIELSTGNYLLMSDANSILEENTLSKLYESFNDSQVGGVSAFEKNKERSDAGSIQARFWTFDNFIKKLEQKICSAVSFSGSCYMIKKEFADSIPNGVTDDFFLSTGIIKRKKNLITNYDAVVWENASGNLKSHFNRRIRITIRGLTSLSHRSELLNPFKYGLYSWMLFSHKVVRRYILLTLPIIYLTNLFIYNSPLTLFTLICQTLFYALAVIGFFIQLPKTLSIPSLIASHIFAIICGIFYFLSGSKKNSWQSIR